MTTPIGTYSSLDLMLAANSSFESQIGDLQQQTTTGLVSQSYAGIASVTPQVLNLQAASDASDAYTSAITAAQGKASAMQTALTQIHSMVASMAASTLTLTSSSNADTVNTVAAQAKVDLQQIGALLNTSYAGDYVFSGADTANAPIAGASTLDSGAMYTAVGTALNGLTSTPATGTTASVLSAATAAVTANGVYSTYLTGAGAAEATTSPVTVQVGVGQSVALDLPANQMSASTAPGDAISQIMGSLALIANTSTGTQSSSSFNGLMQGVTQNLNSSLGAVDAENGQIGVAQDSLTAAATSQDNMKTLLTTQLSGLTNVDMAKAISSLQEVTNQLEISYRVLGMATSLNLASYLS